ncbi:MAG: hypothetical protein ABJA80_10890 [bacterium]
MERLRLGLSIEVSVIVLVFFGNRMLAQGAAVIPLLGFFFAALALGAILADGLLRWQPRTAA